jgi:hypothetical protein
MAPQKPTNLWRAIPALLAITPLVFVAELVDLLAYPGNRVSKAADRACDAVDRWARR